MKTRMLGDDAAATFSVHTDLQVAVVDHAPAAGAWLSEAERRAHDAFATEARRADFRAGRLAAHIATRRLLGHAAPVALLPRAGRAPFVLIDGVCAHTEKRVHVSIAHCEGRAAAAASHSRVGVDLERGDAVSTDQARYFLTRRERTCGGRYSETGLWTLKEAAWKAVALTPAMPLKSLELRFDEKGEVCGICSDGRVHRASALLQRCSGDDILAVVWLADAVIA